MPYSLGKYVADLFQQVGLLETCFQHCDVRVRSCVEVADPLKSLLENMIWQLTFEGKSI